MSEYHQEKYLFAEETATFETLDHDLVDYSLEFKTNKKSTAFGIKLSIKVWLKLKWKKLNSEEEELEEMTYETLV
jgi:hypothetical protein